ncbi:MAG: nucleotidyl transferase AbiEii/AbiGii toxin family protein [Elusimicrobiota bacterium]
MGASNFPTVFHLISEISKKEGITCVLIGGFAVNHYNVTRLTADIDFLTTENDFKKISQLLKKAGYSTKYRQEFFTQLESASGNFLTDIDFMFVNNETLSGIVKDSKKIKIAGLDFLVPSIKHLLALKLHSLKNNFNFRENKDIPDIIDLIKSNNIKFQGNEFEELCLKYGNKKLCNIIREKIGRNSK